jgi:hypothetical protein
MSSSRDGSTRESVSVDDRRPEGTALVARTQGRVPLAPPRPWTSWRDRRDGAVVTVVRVSHWGRRFGLVPAGGQGSVLVEVDGVPRFKAMRRVNEWDWPHFELIYDPYEEN